MGLSIIYLHANWHPLSLHKEYQMNERDIFNKLYSLTIKSSYDDVFKEWQHL